MDDNQQDKTESKQTATGGTLPPLLSKDQSKPGNQAQSYAGKAFTKPSTSKAIHLLLAIALSIAMVGVIVLIYMCFRLNWSLWIPIPLTLVGILLLVLLIHEGYSAQWTGFRVYVKETKAYTDGQSTTTTRDQQPGKTLWDWLQLLIIPIVLASATLGFGLWQAYLAQQQHDNDQKLAQMQRLQDKAIALDQQQADTLQKYMDNIQDLLLNHNLLKASSFDINNPYYDVATLARARTLTALQALDPQRKGRLVQFLYEAKLIGFQDNNKTHGPIIDLSGAVLSGAVLSGAHLTNANLTGANLTGADLSGAVLTRAVLSGVHNITQQQLEQVHLCYGAILPPGLTCHHNQ